MCTISFVWCRSVSIFHASYGKFDVHSSRMNWKNNSRGRRKRERESGHCPASPSYFILCFGDVQVIVTLWWFHTLSMHGWGKVITSQHRERERLCWWNTLPTFARSLFICSVKSMRSGACVWAPVKQSSTNPKTNSSPCMPIFREEIRSSSQSVECVYERANAHTIPMKWENPGNEKASEPLK